MDSGNEILDLTLLKEQAERENVTVFALTLREFGRHSCRIPFLSRAQSDKGGFTAEISASWIAVLSRSGDAEKRADPFSVLTAATGGTQFHFRKQSQLEDGLATIGVELRSAYVLNYYPTSTQTGHHTVKIEVAVPGAKVYSRPGYWRATD